MEKTCQNCHEKNPEKAKFCLSCGAGLRSEQTCPECTTENPLNAKFCLECGHAFTKDHEDTEIEKDDVSEDTVDGESASETDDDQLIEEKSGSKPKVLSPAKKNPSVIPIAKTAANEIPNKIFVFIGTTLEKTSFNIFLLSQYDITILLRIFV